MRHCCQPRVASTDCGMGGGWWWRGGGLTPTELRRYLECRQLRTGGTSGGGVASSTRTARPGNAALLSCASVSAAAAPTPIELCVQQTPTAARQPAPGLISLQHSHTLTQLSTPLLYSAGTMRPRPKTSASYLSLPCQAHLTVALRGYFTDGIAAEFRIYMKQKSGWVHPGGSTAEV